MKQLLTRSPRLSLVVGAAGVGAAASHPDGTALGENADATGDKATATQAVEL